MRLLAHLSLAILLALTALPSAVHAQTIYVAIRVNDSTITNYDINARAKLLQLQRMAAATARAKAEDELIQEALQMQEARRLSIVVSEAEVDEAFGNIASNTRMSPSKFRQALRGVGVDADTLRNRLRAAIAWRSVVQAKFRATVRIREEDVVAAMLQRSDDSQAQSGKVTEYTLTQVIFIVPEGASDAQRRQRRNEAAALRSRFVSCDASLDIARSLRDVAVKDAGRRFSTDLPEALAKQLDETPNGRLTAPTDSADGIEMIAVCDKRETSGTSGAQREIQSEMMNEEGALMARGYIRDLRANAIIIRQGN